MAKLTAKERNALPSKDFAVPSKRAYPIDTPNRGRNALARVSQNGYSELKAQVRRAVAKKYPEIGED